MKVSERHSAVKFPQEYSVNRFMLPRKSAKKVHPAICISDSNSKSLKDMIGLLTSEVRRLRPEVNLKEIYKTLPLSLKHIKEVIIDSEYIYSLNDDWDDNGSKGYKKRNVVASSEFNFNIRYLCFK